jgi:BASS family bile acid:Na+ symporter
MFDFYIRYEYWFAATQLALAMLGMGATLRMRDFVAVFTTPRALLLGLLIQLVLVPLFGWAIIALSKPAAGLAVGLALCAAIPGGTMSNVLTFLARGHVALSIALTAVSSFACLFTTPIVLSLLIGAYLPGEFDMPAARIAMEITLILMLPLAMGMVVLSVWPNGSARFSKNCIRLSIFVIVLIVIGAAGAGRIDIDKFNSRDIATLVAFIAGLAICSWLVARLAGLNRPDSATINIEVAFRNSNLGLLIKASLFPAIVGVADPVGDMVLFTVLLYAGLAMPAAVLLVFLHGRAIRREISAATAAPSGPG